MKKFRPSRYPRRRPTRRILLNMYRALYRHYGPRHWWPAESPLEVIVGAVLTQNTAWKNVEKAIENLKGKGLLDVRKLERISSGDLANLIRPAGYFNIKADRLKHVIEFFSRNGRREPGDFFKGHTAALRRQLLEVKGVGEETADSILLYAGRRRSFVVDAYTRRVLMRHRLIGGKESYGEIQKIFMDALPSRTSLYNDYHAQIVEVGKDYCRKEPRCNDCPLRNYL